MKIYEIWAAEAGLPEISRHYYTFDDIEDADMQYYFFLTDPEFVNPFIKEVESDMLL